jgi:phosphoglycerate dehydrogenase-like enzyme
MIDANNYLKQGYWVKEAFTSCKGLKEQTLGLIGFGKIAQLVCKMAIALEMKVLVYTRT